MTRGAFGQVEPFASAERIAFFPRSVAMRKAKWVSLILVIVVLGVTFYKIFNQLSLDVSRKKVQKDINDDLRRFNESRDENSGVDDRKSR